MSTDQLRQAREEGGALGAEGPGRGTPELDEN